MSVAEPKARIYIDNTIVGQYPKLFFEIAYHPLYKVENTFPNFSSIILANTRQLDFLQYLSSNYICPQSLFSPFL